MVDFEKATAELVSRGIREETRYLFSHEQFQETLCDPFDCAEETQHQQDSVGEKKMPSNNKLQEGGISLPCKKRLTTLTTSFKRIAST